MGGVAAAQASAADVAGPSSSSLSATTSAAGEFKDDFSRNVASLRRSWRFAAVCQFMMTFEDAFGMSGFKSATLEHDLASAKYEVVPDLMRRLLYTLTLSRDVSTENWQTHLRKQYHRRAELDEEGQPITASPLGSEETPVEWNTLSLAMKLRTIHDLCEWQMVDPERFRKLVRSDEDAENWRIYPIGWDAQENTYWLFDDSRLWIQHPPPPPPPKARPTPKKGSKRARAEAAAAKKAAKAAEAKSAKAEAARKAPARSSAKRVASGSSVAQGSASKKARTSLGATESRASGTRSSRRLRGGEGQDDDGWEAVPAELLKSEKSRDNDDDDSELSEPPEEEAEDVKPHSEDAQANDDEETADETMASVNDEQADMETAVKAEEQNGSDEPDWIEFETIAVTRSEWEAMQTRFAKSKHPDEKALHNYLRDEIIPRIITEFEEAEKQAALDAAMAARKRSSRIANKEAEREEERKQAEARAEQEERMRRVRAEEEEAERKKEEAANEERKREDRMREREERIKQRERDAERKAIQEMEERERREKMREMRKRKRELLAAGEGLPGDLAAVGSGAASDVAENDEDWDLACEICKKAARNPELDADEQIVCCESCLVWQHTKCWDAYDVWRGKEKRNWDDEDFFCTDCQAHLAPEDKPYDKAAVTQQQDQYRRHRAEVTANGSQGSPNASAVKKITIKRSASKGSAQGTPSPAPGPSGAPSGQQLAAASPLARPPHQPQHGSDGVPIVPSQQLRPTYPGIQHSQMGGPPTHIGSSYPGYPPRPYGAPQYPQPMMQPQQPQPGALYQQVPASAQHHQYSQYPGQFQAAAPQAGVFAHGSDQRAPQQQSPQQQYVQQQYPQQQYPQQQYPQQQYPQQQYPPQQHAQQQSPSQRPPPPQGHQQQQKPPHYAAAPAQSSPQYQAGAPSRPTAQPASAGQLSPQNHSSLQTPHVPDAAPPSSQGSAHPMVPVPNGANGGTPNRPMLGPSTPAAPSIASTGAAAMANPVPMTSSANNATTVGSSSSAASRTPVSSPKAASPSYSNTYRPPGRNVSSTPTGSFPIRRPAASPGAPGTNGSSTGLASSSGLAPPAAFGTSAPGARSPLSGPSILSPEQGKAPPPLQLGSGGTRGTSPSPASSGGGARPSGPLTAMTPSTGSVAPSQAPSVPSHASQPGMAGETAATAAPGTDAAAKAAPTSNPSSSTTQQLGQQTLSKTS
ncbi:unnamed protein product [Jaminaea pallidilutea]